MNVHMTESAKELATKKINMTTVLVSKPQKTNLASLLFCLYLLVSPLVQPFQHGASCALLVSGVEQPLSLSLRPHLYDPRGHHK